MEKCQHIFNLIDTDYNEVFDEGEFTRYLLEAGKSMSDRQFHAMLGQYKISASQACLGEAEQLDASTSSCTGWFSGNQADLDTDAGIWNRQQHRQVSYSSCL